MMAAVAKTVSENDYDSPGYEYLRSYQNMSNLYNKLIALNYQRDFCSAYKCPPIHKYYFATPSKNTEEQQYLFTCICAWLIKDKCQMNLQLDPEEYEDLDVTIGVILDSLRLLLINDDDADPRASRKKTLGFPPGRLKLGYGPEVIWAMNVLADRALELALESEPAENRSIKVVYDDKKTAELGKRASGRCSNNSYITIGQPFVGGSLTTRPLGNYQIDDVNLFFDDDIVDETNKTQTDKEDADSDATNSMDSSQWYERVERAEHILKGDGWSTENKSVSLTYQDYLKTLIDTRKTINEFMRQSRPVLEEVQMRIDRQLQVISDKETYLQSSLGTQIEEFLKIWRTYSAVLNRYSELSEQVNAQTDKFESQNEILKRTNTLIETRIKELNDGTKLKELELMINKLKEESADLDMKIGLTLSLVEPKVQK